MEKEWQRKAPAPEKLQPAETESPIEEPHTEIPPDKAREENTKAVEAVRSRLGLSRRDMLTGMLATAAAPFVESRMARALSPEQEQSYENSPDYQKGMRELREQAREGTQEELRLFVGHADGRGEWVLSKHNAEYDIPNKGFGGAAIVMPDEAFRQEVERLRKGAVVTEQVHTHPTHLILASNVPPSPTDMISGMQQALESRGGPPRRFSVVTESGVWGYTPVSIEAAQKFTASLSVLESQRTAFEKQREGGKEFLREILKLAKENDILPPDKLQDASKPKTLDYILSNMADNPQEIYSLTLLYDTIPDTELPSKEARAYLQLLREARDKLTTSLRSVSPGFDGGLFQFPTGPHDREYVERWKGLGISLTYTPFDGEKD